MTTPTKILIAVHSPKRGEGLKGVFAGGLHWPEGTTTQEVALERLADVQAKQDKHMLKILAVGEADVRTALAAEKKAHEELAHAAAENDKRVAAARAKLPPGVQPRGGASRLPGASSATHSLAQSGADFREELERRRDEIDAEFTKRDADLRAEADKLKKTANEAEEKIAKAHDELTRKGLDLTKREADLAAKEKEIAEAAKHKHK